MIKAEPRAGPSCEGLPLRRGRPCLLILLILIYVFEQKKNQDVYFSTDFPMLGALPILIYFFFASCSAAGYKSHVRWYFSFVKQKEKVDSNNAERRAYRWVNIDTSARGYLKHEKKNPFQTLCASQ